MKQRLKLHLWRTNSTVHFQVLEQEGIYTNLSDNVKIVCCIELDDYEIYLRGYDTKDDCLIKNRYFDTEQEAIDYIEKVVSWLDKVFPAKEPKRGDMVMVYDDYDCIKKPQKRRYVCDIFGSYAPICVVAFNDVQKFLNGEQFDVENWKHMQPISSNWNPETGIYEAERDV